MIDVAAFLTESSLSIGAHDRIMRNSGVLDTILAGWRQQQAPAT